MSVYIIPAGMLLLGSVVITVWASMMCWYCTHTCRRSDQSIILCGVALFLMLLNGIITKQYEYANGVKSLFDFVIVTVFEYAMLTQLMRRRYVKH